MSNIRTIIEFATIPLGEESLSRYVAQVVKFLEEKKVKYQLIPMGTIIEIASLGDGFKIIKEPHELIFKLGAKRVSTTIRIDNRRDRDRHMEDRVKSVFEKIWRD